MNLSVRKKGIIILASALLVATVLFCTSVKSLLDDNIKEIEKDRIENGINSIQNEFHFQSTNLKESVKNFAVIYDNHLALGEKINSDQLNSPANKLPVDFAVVVRDKAIVYEYQSVIINQDDIKNLLELAASPEIRARINHEGIVSGFLKTSSGNMLVAICAGGKNLPKSSNTGTIYISGSYVAGLVEQLPKKDEVILTLFDLEDPLLTEDLDLIKTVFRAGKTEIVKPYQAGELTKYFLISDVYGDLGFVLSLRATGLSDSEVFRLLKAINFSFMLSLLLCGFLFYILWEKKIVTKINILSTGFKKLKQEEDLSIRIPVFGNDEFAHLTSQINDTLQSLQESKQKEKQFQFSAFHDSLTLLPNRKFFMEQLNQTLQNLKDGIGIQAAVLFIDLDRFKLVNDSYNHTFGDHVLIEAARKFKKCLRQQDIVARYGGDEFVVLLNDIQNQEEAIQVAQRLHAEFLSPIESEDTQKVYVTLSIGIDFISSNSEPSDILQNADAAMYNCKFNGRNGITIYDETIQTQHQNLVKLKSDLYNAIEKNEFFLHYQPILSIQTGKIVAVEALLRWNHPQRGLVSPDKFISQAEDLGMISSIGKIVIKLALNQLHLWSEDGLSDFMMSINVSPKQFSNAKFFGELAAAITLACVSPDKVQIEITETAAMMNIESCEVILEMISQLGIKIAMDDFGQGYSSIAYAQRFPAQTLKIDQAFIRKGLHTVDDEMLVSAIISMGHALGMEVVAEGVETWHEYEVLVNHQCDYIQGYLLGRPMPAEEITKFIRSHSPEAWAKNRSILSNF